MTYLSVACSTIGNTFCIIAGNKVKLSFLFPFSFLTFFLELIEMTRISYKESNQFFHTVYAQSDSIIAVQKGEEALQLMENNQIDEALDLLKEAKKLDKKNIIYPYEIAYA